MIAQVMVAGMPFVSADKVFDSGIVYISPFDVKYHCDKYCEVKSCNEIIHIISIHCILGLRHQ